VGFFNNLFVTRKNSAKEVLTAAESQLRLCLFAHLYERYSAIYGQEEGKFWTAAVINEILLETTTNEAAKTFLKEHEQAVQDESFCYNLGDRCAEIVSYLAAADTLLLAIETGSPMSKRATELGEHLSRLNFYIPNTHDICGSGDALECIRTINEYARKLTNEPGFPHARE
jgi:hypothetical protein